MSSLVEPAFAPHVPRGSKPPPCRRAGALRSEGQDGSALSRLPQGLMTRAQYSAASRECAGWMRAACHISVTHSWFILFKASRTETPGFLLGHDDSIELFSCFPCGLHFPSTFTSTHKAEGFRSANRDRSIPVPPSSRKKPPLNMADGITLRSPACQSGRLLIIRHKVRSQKLTWQLTSDPHYSPVDRINSAQQNDF